MDGEKNGKPYEQLDDLGGPPLFLETPILNYTTQLPYMVIFFINWNKDPY